LNGVCSTPRARSAAEARVIETFMAQQLRQVDQLARMLAQPGKCESMTQTVGGNLGASQAGPPDQGGDGILN
jgi:hypothetical protein